MATNEAFARSGARSISAWPASAWTTIVDTECATTSCSSRAIRVRSSPRPAARARPVPARSGGLLSDLGHQLALALQRATCDPEGGVEQGDEREVAEVTAVREVGSADDADKGNQTGYGDAQFSVGRDEVAETIAIATAEPVSQISPKASRGANATSTPARLATGRHIAKPAGRPTPVRAEVRRAVGTRTWSMLRPSRSAPCRQCEVDRLNAAGLSTIRRTYSLARCPPYPIWR